MAVALRVQTALTVILLGFNNDRAGRMALFAHARRVAAISWCGELWGAVPRRPPPWATALRRAAAVWCGGFPRARRARFLLHAPAGPPCCVRGHAPPGARRAPRALEDVKKVLTALVDMEDMVGHGCPTSPDA